MEPLQNLNSTNQKIIKGARLNIVVLVLTIPLACVSIIPFAYLHGWQQTLCEINTLLNIKLFVLLFGGILIHEALHGFTWMLLLKKGFKHIKFGFNVHSMSPYTHCNIPMKAWQYKLGGLMPGLLMGIIPIVISFIVKNTALNFVGFLFLWAAGGDLISLFMLRKIKRNTMVMDHPDEMGFIIVDKKNEKCLSRKK